VLSVLGFRNGPAPILEVNLSGSIAGHSKEWKAFQSRIRVSGGW
jgi:hypothetical protein